MHRIWMAIAPSSRETRLLATAGPQETLLKARLAAQPRHERAIGSLLDALALWQGRKVHAALAVDEHWPSCATSPWPSFVGYDDTPLYTLDLVPVRRPGRRRGLHGLGDFRDLHRLLHREVAR